MKHLILFLALAFAAPAASAAPTDFATNGDETMQTDQPTPFAYDVPDAILHDFGDAFEEVVGPERDGPTLVAKAMNVVDRMIADGKLARRNYEVVVRPVRAHLLVRVEMTGRPVDYGQIGYDAYAQSTGSKTFDGRDMPQWEALPERIQQAWTVAAVAIRGAT